MESINNNNYELWLVRYADGDLTAAERAAVEQWLEGHPEAAEELKLYGEAPRLERDESVGYAAAVPGRVQPLWLSVLRWSAAAAVVAALVVPAVRWLTPQEQPVVVAQVEPEAVPAATDDSLILPVERQTITSELSAKPTAHHRGRRSEEASLMAEAAEEAVPEEMEVEMIQPETESLLAEEIVVEEQQETISPVVETPSVVEEQPLVYVDNLFVVDSGSVIEQRLLAANENIKERLQSTYLGRRLARRMPTGDELLDYTDNLRERTPEGVRMMADMVLAYNESNK